MTTHSFPRWENVAKQRREEELLDLVRETLVQLNGLADRLENYVGDIEEPSNGDQPPLR